MTGAPAAKPYVPYAEYLAMEEKSATKHEWLDGIVYDLMHGRRHAGPRRARGGHHRLVGAGLRGKPCRAISSDLRVRVPATGLSTYADVTVVCGKLETDPEDANAVTNPTLLVEVLSDSTEAYDRGEKFAHYRRLPSLREYVLVSQHAPRIEIWRRNERGRWELAQEAEAASRPCSRASGARSRSTRCMPIRWPGAADSRRFGWYQSRGARGRRIRGDRTGFCGRTMSHGVSKTTP